MESTLANEQDKTIEQAVQLLPPEIQDEVREFIESLLGVQIKPTQYRRPTLSWRGALRDLRAQYTSVELEHSIHDISIPLDIILKRIDAIVIELQELRQVVLISQQSPDQDLATELYGSWGHGTWEECEPGIDWQRFSNE